MAAVPDFGALAQQQQAANDDATRRTTWSQRPDQSSAMGNITWNQTPDGRWINSSTLNGGAHNVFDQTLSGQSGLAGQIGAGLNSDGLMGWGSSDLNGNLGAMPEVGKYNQQVIDSWNALQAPGLAQSEAAQRQRLAAQGITLGSNVSNTSERNLGNVRTDAGNKAILAGYTQGNTEFDQAMRARSQGYTENLGESQLQNSMRGQQFGERQSGYNAAIAGSGALTAARNSLNPNDWASKVSTGAAYIPQTIYGAAQDTFNANQMNENASRASSQANVDSGVNALRALGGAGGLGSMFSGIGSAASGLWNWASTPSGGWDAWNYGNNGGGDSLGDFISNNGW